MAMDKGRVAESNAAITKESEAIMENIGNQATMPNQVDMPAAPAQQPSQEPAQPADAE